MQYSSSQQVELCPPIHLSLEHLQAVDLSFYLTLTAFKFQSRIHRCPILCNSFDKVFQFLDAAFLSRLHPVVKVRFKPFSDYCSKLLSKHLYF